jgi:hypothetical protein
MTEPATKAGKWLVERTRWDAGMRGFFVRINQTGGPEDMRVHVLAIEREAATLDVPKLIAHLRQQVRNDSESASWRHGVEYAIECIESAARDG